MPRERQISALNVISKEMYTMTFPDEVWPDIFHFCCKLLRQDALAPLFERNSDICGDELSLVLQLSPPGDRCYGLGQDETLHQRTYKATVAFGLSSTNSG